MATLIPALGACTSRVIAGERPLTQFALAFPATEKVASLMRHLSWTHFLQLLPLKTEAARWFYAQQSVESRWSVRELRHQIERKAFHRTDPTLVFKDPYFLDFLSLRRLVAIELKLDRFPSDFLFQLTADEKTEVVANCDHLLNLKFSKALLFAFTEHGAIQAP